MPVYKLHYFPGRGKANPVRFVMAFAELEWTEGGIRERKDFLDLIDSGNLAPFNQVPLLLIDDTPFVQSGATIRYLANDLGLYGDASTAIEKYQVECHADGALDFYNKFVPYPFASDKEKFLKENIINVGMAKYMPIFNDLLKGKEFLGGSSASYADAILLCALEFAFDLAPEEAKKYDNIVAFNERMWAMDSFVKFKTSPNRQPIPDDQYKHDVDAGLGRI
eukprot:m.240680 g.240680  ORF g.240680 m.240680 type:complete len:222 (+) comp15760_c0_seq1:16-681(+)